MVLVGVGQGSCLWDPIGWVWDLGIATERCDRRGSGFGGEASFLVVGGRQLHKFWYFSMAEGLRRSMELMSSCFAVVASVQGQERRRWPWLSSGLCCLSSSLLVGLYDFFALVL